MSGLAADAAAWDAAGGLCRGGSRGGGPWAHPFAITTDAGDAGDGELHVPDHPAWAAETEGMPPTGELIRILTQHFAARALLEQDLALALVAVILDEAPRGVAARVAAILWDIETAEIDPLGVVERVARDLVLAKHVAAAEAAHDDHAVRAQRTDARGGDEC